MELALALPNLIILAIGGYRKALQVYRETKCAEDQLIRIFSKVETQEKCFLVAIEELHQRTGKFDVRNDLTTSSADERWTTATIEIDMQEILGHTRYSAISGCIQNILELLENFLKLLPRRYRCAVEETDRSLGPLRTCLASDTPAGRPRRSFYVLMEQYTVRGRIPALEIVHTELSAANTLFICLLTFIVGETLKKTPANIKPPASFRRVGTYTEIRSEPQSLALSHTAVQRASTDLYNTIASHNHCKCHQLYLSLDTRENKSAGPAEQMPITYSALFAPIALPTGQLGFLTISTGGPKKAQIPASIQGNICSTISIQSTLKADTRVETYSMDSFSVELQRGSSGQIAASPLDELCLDEKLSPYHRYCLAARLAKYALSFRTSPWFSLWDVKTLNFFEKLEDSKRYESWTPHLLSSFPEQPDTSGDLSNLGRVLITVGGVKISSHAPMAHDGGISSALNQLSMKVGRKYRLAVEKCFMAPVAPKEGLDSAEKILKQLADLEDIAKEFFLYKPCLSVILRGTVEADTLCAQDVCSIQHLTTACAMKMVP